MLDSDSLVLRALQSRLLPSGRIATPVPSAYWLRPHFISVTNWLMSVSAHQGIQRRLGEGTPHHNTFVPVYLFLIGTPLQGDISHVAKITSRPKYVENVGRILYGGFCHITQSAFIMRFICVRQSCWVHKKAPHWVRITRWFL